MLKAVRFSFAVLFIESGMLSVASSLMVVFVSAVVLLLTIEVLMSLLLSREEQFFSVVLFKL